MIVTFSAPTSATSSATMSVIAGMTVAAVPAGASG
jgi:hypothetical protein